MFDGSGAALPPVAAGARVLVVGVRGGPVDVAAGYLNTYRALIADLVVVTMAEDDAPLRALATALSGLRPARDVR